MPSPRQRSATTDAEILTVLKRIEHNLERIADKLDALRVELEFTTDAAAADTRALQGVSGSNCQPETKGMCS